METHNYELTFTVPISPAAAMRGISNVKAWWVTDITGSSEKNGDVFTMRIGKTWETFQITELTPDKRVVWLVLDGSIELLEQKDEWNGTRVIWELSGDEKQCTVRMTHEGLTPLLPCYQICEPGWNDAAGESLKNYLTTGKGQPKS